MRWLKGDRPVAGDRWQDSGAEPDYRFSLANERTFLAWTRTSLAFMAGAVAVVQLIPASDLHGTRRVLGVVLAVLGILVSATAYTRWAANQRAMRNGEPLPQTRLLYVVSGALSLVGLVVLVLVAIA